jgi:hypothetical protein
MPIDPTDCKSLPEITVFSKIGAPLTKRISLDGKGNIVSDSSHCRMGRGFADRVQIANIHELGTLISSLKSYQAIALGALKEGLPNKVHVVTKDMHGRSKTPNTISRSREYTVFGKRRGFVLLDHDAKGMPPNVAERIAAAGGFVGALTQVLPALARTAYLVRASTSAGIYRIDSGEKFKGSGGVHLFIAVEDVSDTPRFIQTLHERAWLCGFGWYWVSNAGQLLERSIIDRSTATPEHLIFEGPPTLIPPLAQDFAMRVPRIVEGN